jgi:outer membrane protein assembly factor BamB
MVLSAPAQNADVWAEFRGRDGRGIADATGLPITWSEKENVKWKTAIPGKGWSSPVIRSNQIWTTTATDDEKLLHAICVDRASGRIVHDVELFRLVAPERLSSQLSGFASPTPAIEPGRLYASFGRYGNVCVATETGKILWKNQEFTFDHDNNGPGSSPILYDGLYLINCDGTDVQYVAALDKETGRVVWRTSRSSPNLTNPGGNKSYGTPLVVKINDRDQLVSPGPMRVSSYEPATGKEIWACDIPGWAIVPRPQIWGNLVYVCTGGTQPELWAIRMDGVGVVTHTHVAWKYKRNVPMVASPLVIGDCIYMVSDNGIASCVTARTGEQIWNERLPAGGSYYASPLFVDGRIYFFSDNGKTTLVKPAPRFEVLAVNSLSAGCMATPAVAGKAFYIRTKTHLYRIEK